MVHSIEIIVLIWLLSFVDLLSIFLSGYIPVWNFCIYLIYFTLRTPLSLCLCLSLPLFFTPSLSSLSLSLSLSLPPYLPPSPPLSPSLCLLVSLCLSLSLHLLHSNFHIFLFSFHFRFFFFSLPSSSITAEVTIGFERTFYTVRETDGTVTVCIVLVSGALAREAIVFLYTVWATAKGIYNTHIQKYQHHKTDFLTLPISFLSPLHLISPSLRSN